MSKHQITIESVEQVLESLRSADQTRPLTVGEIREIRSRVAPSASVWVPTDRDTVKPYHGLRSFVLLDDVHDKGILWWLEVDWNVRIQDTSDPEPAREAGYTRLDEDGDGEVTVA